MRVVALEEAFWLDTLQRSGPDRVPQRRSATTLPVAHGGSDSLTGSPRQRGRRRAIDTRSGRGANHTTFRWLQVLGREGPLE
jgi:hypothetical protein